MPQFQYPFIDIAVHPAVRARFAAGDAIALFSPDMTNVLWANGEGAGFFGYSDIYGLLDNGPNRASVSFRQLAATAAQLREAGDRRSLTIRTSSGFQSATVMADVTLVELRKGDTVVIFSAPVAANAGSDKARISAMLKGFDDPDTHMAVLDSEGNVLEASHGFGTVGISADTSRNLIASLRHSDGLIKRPIATAAGYLPAAIGTVSEHPPLHLLFCVETVLGRMDPPHEPLAGIALVAEAAAFASDMAEDTIDMPEEPFADDMVEPVEEEVTSDTVPETATEPAGADDIAPEQETVAPDETELAADEAKSLDQQVTPPEDFLEAEPSVDVEDIEDADDLEEIGELAILDGVEPRDIEAAAIEDAGMEHEDVDTDVTDVEPPTALEASTEDEAPVAEDEPLVEPIATDGSENAASVNEDVVALAEPAHDASQPFVFRREGRPVRFVWKLDAQGRFAEVSDEFARTVGPHSGDINGLHFQELAHRFHLDANGEIGRLLERRDTWSGRMIRWPVEGTNLTVPVDLAALPTYSRNREFDGFRGFGIIRVGDAEEDPRALGLQIGEVGREPVSEPEERPEDISLTVDDQFEEAVDAAEPVADDAPVEDPQDEFQGEKPALNIISNPLANFSEKIVQLEERRNRAREGLTQAEQNALKEIARQLEPFGKRPNELVAGASEETESDETTENDNDAVDVTSDDGHEEFPLAASEPAASEDAVEIPVSIEEPTAEVDDFLAAAENDVEATEEANGPGLTASAADEVPLAILIHAGDRLIHANSEFRRFSGYDSVEALDAVGGLDSLISRREGPDGGVYMVRANGTQIPVAARLQSVKYEGATALMLTLMPASALLVEEPSAEDEQAARRLSALQVEADELRAILETATDGVVVLDTDGRIRSMNRSASALFNFDDNETRGKPFAMLFAHESQKAVQDYVAGLSGHGVASVLNDGREVIGREASGGFIPLFMTMGRMAGSNSYCAVIRDITQWKRSEEELRTAKRSAETANQHKSDFLARVSHEIRTPLNAIIGFSDMIASEHFGPAGHPRYVEYAHDIGRSGRHVLDIVNDLLDISKIEAGEMDVEFAAVGLNDCISEAVSLVQPQANAQRVIIRTSLSQSVPDVVADLRSIKQIAINILANAIRFTPSGGQIVVSTAYEPTGSVTLRIRDTGVGMSKSELEQAMKPFGQVQPGARKRGDGTGLGLPLTKAMIEANRAQFSIQSAPNEGTLVEITFPPQRVLAN
jgi:PAS domain S-box-containing protein